MDMLPFIIKIRGGNMITIGTKVKRECGCAVSSGIVEKISDGQARVRLTNGQIVTIDLSDLEIDIDTA